MSVCVSECVSVCVCVCVCVCTYIFRQTTYHQERAADHAYDEE